jgi:uncharacterized protein
MKRTASALAAGLLFGLGLAISQMTNPAKVLNFLDVTGRWDPSLLLVLGAAVLVTVTSFRWVLRREAPLFDARFHVPSRRDLDRRLLIGAAIFGIGWGIGGYCPGPAFASLSAFGRDAFVFVAAMIAGSLAYRAWSAGKDSGT